MDGPRLRCTLSTNFFLPFAPSPRRARPAFGRDDRHVLLGLLGHFTTLFTYSTQHTKRPLSCQKYIFPVLGNWEPGQGMMGYPNEPGWRWILCYHGLSCMRWSSFWLWREVQILQTAVKLSLRKRRGWRVCLVAFVEWSAGVDVDADLRICR